jgi:hypothetical protein
LGLTYSITGFSPRKTSTSFADPDIPKASRSLVFWMFPIYEKSVPSRILGYHQLRLWHCGYLKGQCTASARSELLERRRTHAAGPALKISWLFKQRQRLPIGPCRAFPSLDARQLSRLARSMGAPTIVSVSAASSAVRPRVDAVSLQRQPGWNVLLCWSRTVAPLDTAGARRNTQPPSRISVRGSLE